MGTCVAVSLALVPAARARQAQTFFEVGESYRTALEDLAGGELELAVSRVVFLGETSSARCVEAIERRTAAQLSAREPESLVGLALLHLAVHQETYLTWSPSYELLRFERFSINGLRDVISLYVQTSTAPERRSLAAGLLTFLAEVIAATRSAQRLDTGRLLLEDALELDPDHRAALHALAVNLELRDRPAQALPHLERLVELAPGNDRYLARRAVLTVKAGRQARGRELLEELRADGPEWTRELATQELARLLASSGRAGEAEAVLRQGLEELPSEKLALQLSALLDPRWMESGQVLFDWLTAARRDAGPSARWLYEDGAKVEIDALRRELGEAVGLRAGALDDAVRRLPPIADDSGLRAACR